MSAWASSTRIYALDKGGWRSGVGRAGGRRGAGNGGTPHGGLSSFFLLNIEFS